LLCCCDAENHRIQKMDIYLILESSIFKVSLFFFKIKPEVFKPKGTSKSKFFINIQLVQN